MTFRSFFVTIFLISSFMLVLLILLPVLWPAQAGSDTPGKESPIKTISYTGRLERETGRTAADGFYDFSFRLFNAEKEGSIIWTETHHSISVKDGTISVSLGSVNPLAWKVLTAGKYWLAVSVRGPGEKEFSELNPRQLLSQTAPAYTSGTTGNASCPHNHSGESWPAPTATAFGLVVRGAAPGIGVKGISTASTGPTFFVNTESIGISGEGDDIGVAGGSGNIGVRGVSLGPTPGIGVEGHSTTNISSLLKPVGSIGIHGQGDNVGVNGLSVGIGVRGISSDGKGVEGTSGTGDGVYGATNGDLPSAGVHGHNSGTGRGVFGESVSGFGVYAKSSGSTVTHAALCAYNDNNSGGMAGYFLNHSNYGTVHMENMSSGEVLFLKSNGGPFLRGLDSSLNVRFRLEGNGEAYADGSWHAGGADLAEMLPAERGLEAGDVLSISEDGTLIRSTQAYQATVAGVYSTKPGFVGGQSIDGGKKGEIPLAITGIVPVKVTAENGAIRPGHLLVASSLPGHAMKSGSNPPQGTIIGKALGKLESGTGIIKMLATLQ